MTSGLVQHYDGINNTRAGHSNTTTVWEDLIGNNTGTVKDKANASPIWEDGCLQLNGNDRVYYSGDISPQYTIMGTMSLWRTSMLHPRFVDSGTSSNT